MAYSQKLLLGLIAAAALVGAPAVAGAQTPPNNECSTGWCGTPRQSGGGGCGCGGGSILVNNTDDGKTYQHTDDYDVDGVPDQIDNCPYVKNRDQADQDADGIGDTCDNCPSAANKDQSDVNANGKGDVCDPDADGDGVLNTKDNCALVPNPGQEDTDKDGIGDVCDNDADNDGVANTADNCPLVYNPDQAADGTFGKACDNDYDKDGVDDLKKDNCPGVFNPDQKRTFPVKGSDRRGDACNTDIDYDGFVNNIDNCSYVANKDQLDADRDGTGDACDRYFCFVVQRQDKDACLDPQKTFQVYSPTLPALDAAGKPVAEDDPVTGQPMRLRLFSNRQNVAFRFTWTVSQAPAGSNAVVTNPQGAVAYSTPWEYHYPADRVATFTPDMPGTYVLKVTGEQVFPDPIDSTFPRTSEYLVTINAHGDAMAAGCSAGNTGATPGRATTAAGLFALGALGLLLLAHRARTAAARARA